MELRYAQLMKQQEKMVQEMEKSVAQRETIVLRTELENKKSSKKVYTHTRTRMHVQRPFVRDYPGEPVPERQNHSRFY